jgi:hypothetical protein
MRDACMRDAVTPRDGEPRTDGAAANRRRPAVAVHEDHGALLRGVDASPLSRPPG